MSVRESPFTLPNYELVDSGDLEKLERFGDRLIARPSTLCIWRKRKTTEWRKADAVFDTQKGWHFAKVRFESWQADFGSFKLELNLQQNGQIGIFPEHYAYQHQIPNWLNSSRKDGKPRVLNLFAFTGMASVLAAGCGAEVTHVDNSKRALSWAKNNFVLNGLPESAVRLINDDALKLVEREVRRNSTYDIVIADPPSFSRISKSSTWDLDNVVAQFLENLLTIVRKDAGVLLFSSHHAALGKEVVQNLISDFVQDNAKYCASALDLTIPETGTSRVLPAGQAVVCRFGDLSTLD